MLLCCGLVVALAAALPAPFTDQSIAQTTPAPAPDGRPPTGPLQRTDSRLWEISLSIDIPSFHKDDNIAEAIIVPVSILDTWWRVDPRSFRAQMSVDMVPVPEALTTLVVNQSRKGDSQAEISVPNFVENQMRATLTWTVETWSCLLDEDAAAAIDWKSGWPEEVRRWIEPSPGLDPREPQIQQLRQRVVQSLSSTAPPLYVAKEAVRTASRALRSGDHQEGNPFGIQTRGIEVRGCTLALQSQVGSESDVVCITVALLRSLGFPARPVIGLVDGKGRPGAGTASKDLTMWGEVYLPRCGWVPFDSDRVRGSVSPTSRMDQRWNGFGTDKDFNQRVPITHEFTIYQPKAADGLRVASYAALCRLKTKLNDPVQGPTDMLIQTNLISRGRGQK